MRLKSIAFVATLVPSLFAAAQAQTVSLDGQWEYCRTKTRDMPAPDVAWSAIKIPSFLRQADGHAFVWFRRSFAPPREFQGRHIFLRFGAVRFVSEVHLNGQKVGGHYGGWEPFEIDVTEHCRVGRPNALLVRAQDVTGVVDQEMDYSKKGRGVRFIRQAEKSIMAPVGSRFDHVDIWQPVELIARSDVYVQDVFVRTSLRKHEIEADVTLRNLSDTVRTVRLASRVSEGPALGAADAAVPANGATTLTFKQPWPSPRLWGPEDPHLYHLVTGVAERGEQLDTRDTRFGFREFWTDGPYMLLNGTRMTFLATAGHPRGELDSEMSKAGAKDFYRRIRETGCVAMRLHANIWPESWYEAADEVGLPIIMESALFCYSKSYALSKPKFWDNYHKHLEGVTKHKRNHPSIVMYSLENEILHCGGEWCEQTTHRLAEAGRFLKGLDPTRPIMYDADHDPEGVADVVNLHYPIDFNRSSMWPDVAYWMEAGAVLRSWPRKFWKWDRKKPLYFGELLHMQHYTEPDPYTALIGDEAYEDFGLAMGKAKAAAWAMQIEGYRACGVSGMCPWTLRESGAFPSDQNARYLAIKRTYQKNAAFVREYDTRFYERESVDRTVYLYNDTLHAARLTLVWELSKGGVVVDGGRKEFNAQPADRFRFSIRLKMPQANARIPLTLALRVLNGDTPAFEDTKRYWVFPRRKLAVPAGRRIAIFEGTDRALSRALADAGTPAISVSDLAQLPEADVLLIGPHALDGQQTQAAGFVVGDESNARGALAEFVRNGGAVVVLEQESYGGLLPATVIDRGCTIAFQRTRDERLFKGALDGDFKFWRGDHAVCRRAIMKPQFGRFRALVDSGGPAGMVYLPLCELLDGKGRFILSQLLIGKKLGQEPLAGVMLENLLAYASRRPAPTVALAVVQDKLPITEALSEIDAHFTDVSGKLAGTDLTQFAVLIAETDCPEVEHNQVRIRAFVERGGKVVLHRGTRDGLRKVQALFPEPIMAQRSNALPLCIAAWDPAINGLTNQELHWYGSRTGLSYRVRTPLSPDVCRYVIGAGPPDPTQCVTVEAESMAVAERAPRIGESDVYMGATGAIKKTLRFPQTGAYSIAVRGRGTPLGGVYPQIRITLDGKRCGSLSTDGEEWDTYSIAAQVTEGEHEIMLAFVNDAWAPEKGEDRNVWIDKVVYGPTPAMGSRQLLSPAALVRVPLAKGFYLLDQIAWTGEAAGSEKAGRYVSNILTNLGCAFGPQAGALVIEAAKMLPDGKIGRHTTQAGQAYLGTNGTIYTQVHFAKARTYRFAVKASGTEAGDAYPNIDVSIDGEKIGALALTRPGWQVLRLRADVAAGEHKVALSFTNDFYDPPADRNLRIAHLEIK